ncbi:UNVERIFIED_CONTAM: hypothetical protein PYX00_005609 [Menopon gallinae]|uniref:phosphatidylinositol 3-kinase n=1 Tax=Menopon gallinae TaxID=328185 RepID=A0AAW2HTS9_9NEOP
MSANGENDYDRQFEADLQKAIALSLESSEYERFRNEKLKKSHESYSADNGTSNKCTPEPFALKPRRRPEPFAPAGKSGLCLPPPPNSSRKNSATESVADDLISFHSPKGKKSFTGISSSDEQLPDQKISNNVSSKILSNNLYPDLDILCQGNLSSSSNSASAIKSVVSSNEFQKAFNSDNSSSLDHPELPLKNVNQLSITKEITDLFQPFYNKQLMLKNSQTFFPSNAVGLNPPNASASLLPGMNKLSVTNQPSIDIMKIVGKKPNNNLIDLIPDNLAQLSVSDKNDKYSVLEVFDPLLSSKTSQENAAAAAPVVDAKCSGDGCNPPEEEDDMDGFDDEDENNQDDKSGCSGSFYDPFDPFDYMQSPTSIEGSQGDPVYSEVVMRVDKSPALETRNFDLTQRRTFYETSDKRQLRLYECIGKRTTGKYSSDSLDFFKMVKSLRNQFPHSDLYTNVGLIISPTIESNYSPGTSVKVVVHSSHSSQPIPFTCDISSSVEHIIVQVICSLKGDMVGSVTDYVLKVYGLSEYLTSETCLGDYEYVHQCIKLEKDVALCIMELSELKRPLARTERDDIEHQNLAIENLLSGESAHAISYDTLKIILETIENEMDKLLKSAREVQGQRSVIHTKSVRQAIQAVCSYMGQIETFEISEALSGLSQLCEQMNAASFRSRTEIKSDEGDYSVVQVVNSKIHFESSILLHCDKIRDALRNLIEANCNAFSVDCELKVIDDGYSGPKSILEFQDSFLLYLEGLHRLNSAWTYTEYFVSAQIWYGTRPIKTCCLSPGVSATTSFYRRVVFDKWLNIDNITVATLPKEARLVFSLYGSTLLPPDHERSKENPNVPQFEHVELGWTAIQLFSYDGILTQGSFFLPIWPPNADKRLGPAPQPGSHYVNDMGILYVRLPDYCGKVVFPEISDKNIKAPMYEFTCLDKNTQQQLMMIVEQDPYAKADLTGREVLWEKRHYLHNIPQALPKVLLAAQTWDYSSLADLHAMIKCWSPMEPLSALQLLLPVFPDREVRTVAISWIKELGSDELVDYLPQLVQALKHETYDTNPLAKFLLERALTSPRVAHHLYWLLTQMLPGSVNQNSSDTLVGDDLAIVGYRYQRRLKTMLRALLAIAGQAMIHRFMSQQVLVQNLFEVAEEVKRAKESVRLKTLHSRLESIHHNLEDTPTSLPLSSSVCVVGIQVRNCSYFPSNTLPLKINFISDESRIFPAIFKVGDYLQQDMLTLQIIRIMDKLWLKEGLDLKMVTFGCVPTGHKRGMIEMVDNSETLRKIQVEHGLTGSFKDKPIAEWLAKHNPSALDYERAVANFTASCAGYSVATYILGICDRHNDNIMLKTSGHLFHVDFGKFLGDAQMFGNFKRDRSPFVLTSDMAYVINGGDKPSQRFHHFVDLCCKAFAIIRKNGNIILNLIGLMTSSGIPGVTLDAVKYVQRALLPNKSNPEASAMFARMIDSSLKSWFTQFNFFLHNLSQLRFTGDHNDGELLSFVPKRYTCEEDGRIRKVQVHGCQKRYDSEKYYIYILKVDRENQPDSTYLFRKYKEFCELHQKLCAMFPLAKCYRFHCLRPMELDNLFVILPFRALEVGSFRYGHLSFDTAQTHYPLKGKLPELMRVSGNAVD